MFLYNVVFTGFGGGSTQWYQLHAMKITFALVLHNLYLLLSQMLLQH